MFGQKLRLLRENKGISQKEMADHLQITRQAYNYYENDKRSPDYDTLRNIADYFQVSTDYLLGRTDTRNTYEIQTIAAHHDGDDWTEEELSDIEKFKEYVRTKRES